MQPEPWINYSAASERSHGEKQMSHTILRSKRSSNLHFFEINWLNNFPPSTADLSRLAEAEAHLLSAAQLPLPGPQRLLAALRRQQLRPQEALEALRKALQMLGCKGLKDWTMLDVRWLYIIFNWIKHVGVLKEYEVAV